MTIDLTRRYAAGEILPTGPDLFELQRLVSKHRTAGPDDVALTAAAVNAALEREHAEQDQAAYDARAEAEEKAERVGRFRRVTAEGPVRLDTGPGPAERLASTVAEVRALRLLAEQSRRDALHAAALVYQGRAHDVGTETILLAADDFAAWLRDEPLPVPDPTRIPTEVEAARLGLVPPVEDIRPPLVEVNGSGVWRVAGHTFTDLRDLDADVAEQLALRLDAALAEDRVERGTGPLVRTAITILRRQR